jgi:hypothetical protein
MQVHVRRESKWIENGVLQVRAQAHIFFKETPLLQAHGSFHKIAIRLENERTISESLHVSP